MYKKIVMKKSRHDEEFDLAKQLYVDSAVLFADLVTYDNTLMCEMLRDDGIDVISTSQYTDGKGGIVEITEPVSFHTIKTIINEFNWLKTHTVKIENGKVTISPKENEEENVKEVTNAESLLWDKPFARTNIPVQGN
jgi:hypothetical protein